MFAPYATLSARRTDDDGDDDDDDDDDDDGDDDDDEQLRKTVKARQLSKFSCLPLISVIAF